MTAALEGGEWSAAHSGRTLPPEKDPVPILQEAGWALGPVWTSGKSRLHRVAIPDPPARSSVAIPTELPGPQEKCKWANRSTNSFSWCSSVTVNRADRVVTVGFRNVTYCERYGP